jgi:hypothetical protein
LRDAIVHRHAVDFDSDYRREEAIAATGGKHALFNAIQVLVDHGDEVILPCNCGHGCEFDHAADEGDHSELAFESFGRGDEC